MRFEFHKEALEEYRQAAQLPYDLLMKLRVRFTEFSIRLLAGG